jgi:hypothetical protein
MNQGEIIQSVRLHDRQLQVLEEMINLLRKKVDEMDDILKSPIRRSVYATRQGKQQESGESKHPKVSVKREDA